jgi:hypothetical protein
MKKWTDKDMVEFARVASQGAYGKYRGCRTLKSKLKKYETIMNTMTVRITERRLYSKIVEVEVDIPDNISIDEVDYYLYENEHLYVDKIEEEMQKAKPIQGWAEEQD